MIGESILRVEGLVTRFDTGYGLVKAVDGVSFDLARGETLGIVGESGSGKSVTNLSILRLVQSPPGRIAAGKVIFSAREGIGTPAFAKDLLAASEEEVRVLRGRNISMIFQDPLTSLNPVLKVGMQIAETISLHQGLGRREARARAIEMLKAIGIAESERRVDDYPHQFSGGMRQRVMIAMALSCNPDILIADEPTTALDVTIQAQILDIIKRLSGRNSTAVILVTHDLGVVAGMCDSVCVMYAGRIVEKAGVDELFYDPKHPYTRGLLDSIPRADRSGTGGSEGQARLFSIPGSPPSLVDMADNCPFNPRCPHAMDICRRSYPPLTSFEGGRTVNCWLHAKEAEHERG